MKIQHFEKHHIQLGSHEKHHSEKYHCEKGGDSYFLQKVAELIMT